MFCALLWALPAEAQYRESVADKIEKAGRAVESLGRAAETWRRTTNDRIAIEAQRDVQIEQTRSNERINDRWATSQDTQTIVWGGVATEQSRNATAEGIYRTSAEHGTSGSVSVKDGRVEASVYKTPTQVGSQVGSGPRVGPLIKP
jgi:hypothetical protein